MEEESFVYRLRPINDKTIEELQKPYLWFSLRKGFNDANDANIGIFIDKNPILEKCLRLRYNDEGIKELKEQLDNTGICCFTKYLPSCKERSHFPNKEKTICIKYNKNKIVKRLFESNYAIANPFHDVVYAQSAIKLTDDGETHIAIKSDENGIQYESIYSLVSDPHLFDELIYRLLSTIDSKFKKQNETRIILGGRNLRYLKNGANGYEVDILQDAIEQVFVYENCPQDYVKQLRNIQYLANKIQKMNEKVAL